MPVPADGRPAPNCRDRHSSRDKAATEAGYTRKGRSIRFAVIPLWHGARMEASGSVRYRRCIMRVVTPRSIAEQLSEVRQAASAFGVDAVVDALERTAREALAVARTDEERELARQLLAVAGQTRVRRSLRR